MWCAVALASQLQAATNKWTKTASGSWEEPFWSLGELPSISHDAIVLDNPGFKALAIGANTTVNHPNSLSIRNLSVSEPNNLLLLNYAGLAVPLNVRTNFSLGPGASLLSYYSAIHASNFFVRGIATFAEQSVANLNATYVFTSGQLNISNAVVSSDVLFVGDGGAFEPAGVVNITGGTLRTSNTYGRAAPRFTQSGGDHITTFLRFPTGGGNGEYILSNGNLLASTVEVAGGLGDSGLFQQTGGRNSNNVLRLWGSDRAGQHHYSGRYSLNSGLLVSGLLDVPGGELVQNGGTNLSGRIDLNATGFLALSNGVLRSSNVVISSPNAFFGNFRSIYAQYGGQQRIDNEIRINSGSKFYLQGGTLTVSNIVVGPSIRIDNNDPYRWYTDDGLNLLSGVLTNTGILTLQGGAVVRANGTTYNLGKLYLTGGGTSVLDMQNGRTILRFLHTSDLPLAPDPASLAILNWSGSTNGGGTDQLIFGTNANSMSPANLAQLFFVNPLGFPPGDYPARILNNGEVVPTSRPSLAYTRSTNQLVLSWSGSYDLFTSTNVAGPFEEIAGATPPYTNSFTDRQRYFILRSRNP